VLVAMRERDEKRGGSVWLKDIGRFGRDDSLGNSMIRGSLQQKQRDRYPLQASQNHLNTWPISPRLEQGPKVGPEPARCALRSDRRMALRFPQPIITLILKPSLWALPRWQVHLKTS